MFYHNINPVLVSLYGIEIRYYGIIYALGFVITYFFILFLARERRIRLSKDDVADYMFYLAVGVVAGARIAYVLFYNLSFYASNPAEIVMLWHGGLSFHGGFVGAIVAAYLFARKKKINMYVLLDMTAIPLGIALALGRIANFLNGELYGRLTDSGFCIDYSHNEFMAYKPEGCRWPSQLFESVKNLAIFGVLFALRNIKRRPGFFTWLFITLYSFLRFFVEFFREPDMQLGFLFGMTMGQLLSILFFFTGLFMLYWGERNGMQKR